jgi:hypothetical protein
MNTPPSGSTSSPTHWQVLGRKVPKKEIVYFTQVVLIYIIVVTAIVNLTLYRDDPESGKLWTALLSSAIGYLLPNPTLKTQQ